jgi:cysteine desulfurase
MFGKNHYFDYAGATPISKGVRAAVQKVEGKYANPSGVYRDGVEVKNEIDRCRKNILNSFDANNMNLVFTSSGTTSVNLAIMGTLKRGDHFITSTIEHPAVLETARHMARNGVEITYLNVDEEGIVKLPELREAINEKTKLVSVMMVNNEVGTVQPIKEIGKIIDDYRRKNETQFPYFHTDACQAINYFDISMRSLRLDMLSFNASKIYGPKGVGALIIRKGVDIQPIIFGGGQEAGLWSGTEDVSKIVGLDAAVSETLEKKCDEVERLKALQSFAFEEIKNNIPDAIVNGDLEKRSPNNINITLPSMDSDEMVIRLDNDGFAVSHKSACASAESTLGSHVLVAMGQQKYASQNIRITMGRETKKADISRLISTVREIYYKYKV